MSKVTSYLQKNYISFLLLGLLIFVYFILRLPNLTLLPVFADEAIYIRWAQVMKSEPTLRFLPISDGKTPLFMWIMMPLFKIFEDPLYAGRILSVGAGLGTLLGLFLLSQTFLSKRVALWTAFLYVITPFFVFFDRMALVDSMLAAFSVWSIYLAFLLIRFPRFDLAMILGYFLGGALLTKTPAFFTILTVPFTALISNLKSSNRQGRILRLAFLWLIALGIAVAIYNILRLGPSFSSLNARNQDYVLSPLDIVFRPWDPFLPHLGDLLDWFPTLLGYGFLIVLGCGIVWAFLKKNLFLIAIILISFVPLIIEMALLRTFTARYILFPITYFTILGAFGIDQLLLKISKKIPVTLATIAIGLLLVIGPSKYLYYLHFDIENTPMPRVEKNGYLRQWTAGFGLKDIAEFLHQQSLNQDIVVGTDGGFGTLPEGLQMYTDKNRRIAFIRW
jgi:4-amino-4-deoxy-L-arabinose transferase-like glycosyltransferase